MMMSLQDEEEDFFSADEESDLTAEISNSKANVESHLSYGKSSSKTTTTHLKQQIGSNKIADDESGDNKTSACSKEGLVKNKKLSEDQDDDYSGLNKKRISLKKVSTREHAISNDVSTSSTSDFDLFPDSDLKKPTEKNNLLDGIERNHQASDGEDEDDDDDEDLAEKIRERNLMIARKYSAELAKNLKQTGQTPAKIPSAPINIGTGKRTSSQDDQDTISKSSLPPAPPPTPNVTSSFSNLDEQMSQIPWRIPPKSRSKTVEEKLRVPEQKNATSSIKNSESPTQSETLQARQALDRLSDLSSSSSNKNLLSRVAEDIEKLTFKPDNSEDQEASGLPLISDLGSTLSGWSWSGASRLIASASQVGSVLKESVANVAQIPHQVSESLSDKASGTESSSRRAEVDEDIASPDKKQADSNIKAVEQETSKAPFMKATDAISNDAIVDFTLSAMESLGKRAFDVMTDRDESGSIQIKGLGRPWEHFLGSKKAEQPPERSTMQEETKPTPLKSNQDPPRSKKDRDIPEELSRSQPSSIDDYRSSSNFSSDKGTELKLRKKRVNVDNQDD